MLIKLIIAMAITMVLASGIGTFHIKNIRNNISDYDKQNMLCTIDEAIMLYYYNHSGQLPSSLNEITLKNMGINDSGWDDYTYTVSSGKFTLSTTLNDGTISKSLNSNKTLPSIYDEDSEVQLK